jgi:hypothetical protein
MAVSPLFGRRIHISGSIAKDSNVATPDCVKWSQEFITTLIKLLLKKGCNFVIPIDAEKKREVDNLPICFDWLIWNVLMENLSSRPVNAVSPLAVAVQHHKSEEQIPEEYQALWEELRQSDFVQIENAAQWNMNSKRMEAQARWGDILITLGGSEGVLYLANLYHDAGKPVIPLNHPLAPSTTGSPFLYSYGLNSSRTIRLFQVDGVTDAHSWINRINYSKTRDLQTQVNMLVGLLEALERPKVFVVRLLKADHEDFKDVQEYFDTVVEPTIDELGYKMQVVDGKQKLDYPRMDQEIFTKLHRSSIVIADITGSRPNCFLELGYAFGRNLPTVVLAKEGTIHPFDIQTLSAHHWKTTGSADERRRLFKEHLNTVKNRPPLVPVDPLIP